MNGSRSQPSVSSFESPQSPLNSCQQTENVSTVSNFGSSARGTRTRSVLQFNERAKGCVLGIFFMCLCIHFPNTLMHSLARGAERRCAQHEGRLIFRAGEAQGVGRLWRAQSPSLSHFFFSSCLIWPRPRKTGTRRVTGGQRETERQRGKKLQLITPGASTITLVI